jgi:hypothetical protein
MLDMQKLLDLNHNDYCHKIDNGLYNLEIILMHRIPAPAKPDSGQFYKSGSGPIATGF